MSCVESGRFKGSEVLMRKRSSFLECWVQRVFHDDDYVFFASVGFVGGGHEVKKRERERESNYYHL